MTVSRSTLRHACFRAKKNVATPENEQVLSIIKPLLAPHQKWANFSKDWDIVIDRSNAILIIKPEVDYDYIHSTCLEISFLAKRQLGFDTLDARAQNVKACVESTMLANIMRWENYGTIWGVTVDIDIKFISTKMFNVDSNQLTVTEEMIEASKKDRAGLNIEMIDAAPLEMTAVPMSDTQKKQFEQFLAQIETPKE